jgi:ribosomal protein L44E
MRKAYQYKLKPNTKQKAAIDNWLELHCSNCGHKVPKELKDRIHTVIIVGLSCVEMSMQL